MIAQTIIPVARPLSPEAARIAAGVLEREYQASHDAREAVALLLVAELLTAVAEGHTVIEPKGLS